MTFSEFAKRLRPIIGDGENTSIFTKTILEFITSEKALEALDGPAPNTYKAYFNGRNKITRLAKKIVRYIDPALFKRQLTSLLKGDAREALCNKFSDVFTDANSYNIEQKISELFAEILREEADPKRKTPQRKISEEPQKDPVEKTATILDESIVFEQYLNQLEKKYESLKTLLYTDTPHRFYDFYVCNRLCISQKRTGHGRMLKVIENITVDELLNYSPHQIIIGTGGIGKSMMMRHLLLDFLKNQHHVENIPIYITLKNYTNKWTSLEDFIFNEIEKSFSSHISNFIKTNYEKYSPILFLDGIDEISYENQASFQAAINQYISKYPESYVIMSSRPGDDFVAFNDFSIAYIVVLSKDQAINLIEKLVFRPDDPDIKGKFIECLKSQLYETHKDFAGNPLLLTIMLMTFEQFAEIPSKIHIFYREAYIALSQKHDASKGAFKRQFLTQLNSTQLENIVQLFCAKSYIKEKYEFTEKEFCDITNGIRAVDLRKYPAFTAQNFLKDLSNNLCLLYYEGAQYHFIHRSFQEYFAACAFASLKDRELFEIANFIDKNHMGADNTLPMLYDMIPSKVEEYIFIPIIEQILYPDKKKLILRKKFLDTLNIHVTIDVVRYWMFLKLMYRVIYYTDNPEHACHQSKSYIYRYFAMKEGFYHDDREVNIMLDTEQHKILKKELGDFCAFKLNKILQDQKLDPIRKFLLSQNCPFWREYQGLKAYYERLKNSMRSDSMDLYDMF